MAVAVYLDANVIIALLTDDPLTERVEALLSAEPAIIISDLGTAEFVSAISRRVRMKDFTVEEGRNAFSLLDDWALTRTRRVHVTSADIRFAELAMRRLDLTLRTADAIHIAIAQRLGATLATFDLKMAECARTLGVAVAP